MPASTGPGAAGGQLPALRLSKPSRTVLWLDTSIELKFAKLARGEALPRDEAQRLHEISALIEEKGTSGAVLCPIGDQDEEIQLGRRLVAETRGLPLFGSPRPAFRRRTDIESREFERAIRAYLSGSDHIVVAWEDGFTSPGEPEPTRLLTPILERRVDAEEEDLRHIEDCGKRQAEQLEGLRRRNRLRGDTLEDQLARERDVSTWLQAVMAAPRHPPPGSTPAQEAAKPLGFALRMFDAWMTVTGLVPTRSEAISYLRSPYFLARPSFDIKCHLNADLLTRERPIRSGDAMDVAQLGAVLPYATIAVTDGDMADRIARLQLGDRFQTTVLSARKRDFPDLMAAVRAL